ncbi:hypothetical protein SAMN04488121_102715 [Chitinophaga filiformis]|uniref:Uncharacterized protein n=1 Tax=Chitinophaga filiformis TaxID=104663 RepID=A0A1G7NB85_CHIFI|nr:hypothetical protein SAMN04488121_102715 [Chitinophaga filiformis]
MINTLVIRFLRRLLSSKIYLTCLSCIFLLFHKAAAQEKEHFYDLKLLDAYVVRMDLGAVILKGRSSCLFRKHHAGALVKIRISDILYMVRKAELDSLSLLKVNYLAINRKELKGISGKKDVIATITPLKNNKDYVLFARVLDSLECRGAIFRHINWAAQSLAPCEKKGRDPFRKYFSSSEK